MFNFSEDDFVPGFRMKDPKKEDPGFRMVPNGNLQPPRNQWPSGYFLGANDLFAGNPYFSGSPAGQTNQAWQYLAKQRTGRENYPSQMSAGNDSLSAWAKCHARCVDQTVDKGYLDSIGEYRRCMRACLNSMGIYDY